jgi:hypothetical protein
VEAETRLRVGEGVVTITFSAGIAWCFSVFDTAKERLVRKIYPLGHVLQDLRVYVRQFSVSGLPCCDRPLLLNPIRGFAVDFILKLTVLDKRVVDMAAGFQRPSHLRGLGFGRVEPELICTANSLRHSFSDILSQTFFLGLGSERC